MLGNSNQKANKRKLLPQGELPIEEKLAKLDQVGLEARRGRRARVEVDVVLESETFVEGGELRGRLEVRIRRGKKGENLWIGGGKVRVCGYEGELIEYFDKIRSDRVGELMRYLSVELGRRTRTYGHPAHLLPLSSPATYFRARKRRVSSDFRFPA
jgi:hypothetical protein